MPTHGDTICGGALYDEMPVGGKTIQIQPELGKFRTFVGQEKKKKTNEKIKIKTKKVLQLAGAALDKFRPSPGRLLITPHPLFLLHRRGIKASDGNTDRGPEDGNWMKDGWGRSGRREVTR